MREPAWVNLVPAAPVEGDFGSTLGGGTPICIDGGSGIGYFLGLDNRIKPLSAFGYAWVEFFGAVGNGIVDDTAAIQRAIDFCALRGGGVVKGTPGKTYLVVTLTITSPNIFLDFERAFVTSSLATADPVVSISPLGIGTKINGSWTLTSGLADPYFFNITAAKCSLIHAKLRKAPAAGGYQFYVRNGANDFLMFDCDTDDSNGFFIEACNGLYLGNRLTARAVGGDDCYAVKCLNATLVTGNRFIGNKVKNYAAVVSLGSEIGAAVADPTYAHVVSDTTVIGNQLENCGTIVFIKPGAVGGINYFDGTVDGVIISDNSLTDLTGQKFERGIAITAGRGARVWNVSGTNNKVKARTTGAAGRAVGARDVYITTEVGGTAPADFKNITVQCDYTDPYDGVANGAGAPGFPVVYIEAVSLGTFGFGTMSGIIVNCNGNGSTETGFLVGFVLDNAVRVEKLILTNVNRVAGVAQAGMFLGSRVMAPGAYISVVPFAGPILAFIGGGSGALITNRGAMVRKAADLIGVNLAAGAAIAFDQEVYDTDTLHDNAVNNTRLNTKLGDAVVEVGATIALANVIVGTIVTVSITKNGVLIYDGAGQIQIGAPGAAPILNVSTGPILVVGGTDYFELFVSTPGDVVVDILAAQTNFWIKGVSTYV